MKIAEKIWGDGNRLNILSTHDWNPILNSVKKLRELEGKTFGEGRLIAEIPLELWHQWAKNAGVRPEDREAMKDVVARNLNDPEYAHFRVWGGTF